MPHGLRLPEVDERRFFTEGGLERSADFERFLRVDWALAALAELVALAVFARRGPRLAAGLPVGRVGKGVILGLLVLVLAWAVALPFGFASHWWLRRHGLVEAGYVEWLVEPWAALAAGVASTSLLIAVVMGLAGSRLRERWWVGAAAVFTGIAAAFAFLAPYIATTGETRDLRGPLARDARMLERREGLGRIDIDVEKVSDDTKTANAFAAGFGPTRRVVLWDTLIKEPFSRKEVRVVLAHELAHLARNHVLKAVAWYALFSLVLAFVVARATRRLGGMANPAAVPVAALVLAVAELALLPFSNAVSRRYEAEADWIALQASRDPRAAQALFKGFSTTSLQQPSPPTWDYVMLQTHPTIMQRIAMARAWSDSTRGGRPER